MRWTWTWVLGLVLGFACAPRIEVRPEVMDVGAMTASMLRAQETQAQCRASVASLGEDVREPCALVCTSERLLPPMRAEASRLLAADAGMDDAWRAPHRTTVTINDAGLVLDVAHPEDGGFSCAKAE